MKPTFDELIDAEQGENRSESRNKNEISKRRMLRETFNS